MKVYIIGRNTVILFFIAIFIMLLGVVIMPWNNGEMIEAAKAKKDLPIYCVETEKPEISISFDAAWVDAIYGLCIES